MKKVLLIIIFLLAVALRFYKLGSVPASLNADEAAIGYNAYSILKTGRDEYGERFPLAFRSFDDYKAPVYIYLTSASVALFGLSDFSVRFISALAGSLTVVMTFLLVSEMAGVNKKSRKDEIQAGSTDLFFVPVCSAFLLAISPWHLQFSRSAYEANLSVFFLVTGLLFFFKSLKKPSDLLFSGIFFVLSMWSYHTTRIFVPLLCVFLFILYFKELTKAKKWLSVSFFTSFLLLLPLIALTLSPTGLVRAKGISSFASPQILEQSVRWLSQDNNSFLSKIFHNRRLEYMREFLKGYLVHFDPQFLFMENAQAKYRAPGMGLMYLWELPFLIIGCYETVRQRQKWSIVVIVWVLLAPVAAAPTLWLPSAVRTIVMLPVLQIIVALGLAAFVRYPGENLRKKFTARYLMLFSIITVSLFYYLHQYYVHLPVDYAFDWQYGRKQVVAAVESLQGNYDRIVVSTTLDQPQVFFLYYLKYDPAQYLKEGGTLSGKFDAQGNHFAKYVFTPPKNYTSSEKEKILYVESAGELPEARRVLDQINLPDGTPEFIIFE